jgi:predicted porin
MKKSLIALAVLAASGAALAQSSVTMYGRIDTSIGSEETLSGKSTKVFSGNLTTSRYGFRGTEDLGGGLRAQFQLENGFNADDGTVGTANAAFNRASWVGLSGAFGQVRLGLSDSPYKDIFDLGVSNALYDSEFTPNKIAYTGVSNSTSRLKDSVRYDTPNFGGISGAVSYSMDETAGVKNDITRLTCATVPVSWMLALDTRIRKMQLRPVTVSTACWLRPITSAWPACRPSTRPASKATV